MLYVLPTQNKSCLVLSCKTARNISASTYSPHFHGKTYRQILQIVAMSDLMYDVECGAYTWLMLTANSIWKYFLKYE